MRPITRDLGRKLTLFKKEIFKLKDVPVLLLTPGFYINDAIIKGHLSVTLLRSLFTISLVILIFLLISPPGLFSDLLASHSVPVKCMCKCTRAQVAVFILPW